MAAITNVELASLLFAEQGSNPATPSSGYGRLFVKADGVYFIDDGGTVTGPLGAGGGGAGSSALLALKTYRPASAVYVSSTSSTFTDVDATNLITTFTAPSSGRVLARLSANLDLAAANQLSWCLRSGSSDVTGTPTAGGYFEGGAANFRASVAMEVSGLTPGASYTWKWGHARTIGGGAASTLYGGPYGQAVMEVWSA